MTPQTASSLTSIHPRILRQRERVGSTILCDMRNGGYAFTFKSRIVARYNSRDTLWFDSCGIRDNATLRAINDVIGNYTKEGLSIVKRDNRWFFQRPPVTASYWSELSTSASTSNTSSGKTVNYVLPTVASFQYHDGCYMKEGILTNWNEKMVELEDLWLTRITTFIAKVSGFLQFNPFEVKSLDTSLTRSELRDIIGAALPTDAQIEAVLHASLRLYDPDQLKNMSEAMDNGPTPLIQRTDRFVRWHLGLAC